jgi:hypothetical protein
MRSTPPTPFLSIACLSSLCLVFYVVLGWTQIETRDSNCLERSVEQIRSLPDLNYLRTIDGQLVSLEGIFSTCDSNWPMCCLYRKFYYWQAEIIEIISDSPRGRFTHKIRVYYNPLTICCPERGDPGKTHGDVAEFYDENGTFMGIAVYMGNGMYCPLPNENYQRR